MRDRILVFITFIVVFSSILSSKGMGQGDPAFNGEWVMIPEQSSEISMMGKFSIEIKMNGADVKILQPRFKDELVLRTGGEENKIPITNRIFPTNVFMGLSMPVGEDRKIKAYWERNGMELRLEESYDILCSQGRSPISATHILAVSDGKEIMTYQIQRSTRSTGPEIKYILKKAGVRNAYYMELEDGWEIDGKLPEKALLISLQGVVDMAGPNLYFIYQESYPFTYTRSVFEFYKKRYYTFEKLETAKQAVETFKEYVNGYVVWDKDVRTSLIVAFTVCGLEKAIAVTEDMIPMMENAGLKKIADFRGQFAGQNDAEIYDWAYNEYWDRCSRDFIIWMGGPHGNVMQPGVADWGIYKKAFFSDLSTVPSDTAEYALANKLLSQMNPMSMVMGWHSYVKDKERDHVKLVSSYGLRVEGLHTLPNVSFSHQIIPTPGFEFKNHHNLVVGKDYTPKKKVYIACVQTDGLGIGAWLKPGRGEIPYAWEVIMNLSWMMPSMQEYFYSMATPNDYFIGCLSGPGYIYPKAVPHDKLPGLINMAKCFMENLDLNVFEIMDYSEGATIDGNTELTKEVVDAYYENMPNAIGFLNGYAPAFTFTSRNGRPLISYDYYLSPTRTEDDAVADLQELATINSKRPYFLLMHVRESSDVKRVKGIIDRLESQFELVPLDVFITMAGKNPTFKERYLQK
ncbi:hypothetical protein JW960_18335 [candidate division KSB1 bacterium]|nr:hypothetical protein [candidate division KSB1 bacterium]